MNNNTKYKQLTRIEREIKSALIKQGIKQAKIASRIGFNRSIVSREIKRGSREVEIKTTKKNIPLTEKEMKYDARQAQKSMKSDNAAVANDIRHLKRQAM